MKLANIYARYSGSVEMKLNADISAIERKAQPSSLLDTIKLQEKKLKVTPDDLSGKSRGSAFSKMMFLAFEGRGAADWETNLQISMRYKDNKYGLQYHHIFPKAYLRANVGKYIGHEDHIANIAYISGRTNRWYSSKPPSMYIPRIIRDKGSSRVLDDQCVPTSPALLKVENYDRFIERRSKLIADRLNEFIGLE